VQPRDIGTGGDNCTRWHGPGSAGKDYHQDPFQDAATHPTAGTSGAPSWAAPRWSPTCSPAGTAPAPGAGMSEGAVSALSGLAQDHH